MNGSCPGIDLLVAEGDDGGFGYNYGNPTWSDMTAAMDNAAATVTVTPNLEDLSFMLQFDALWVDQRWIDGTLTAGEINNLATYIGTGRRVVMIGESASWSTWNSQILDLAGGAYSGGEVAGGLINTITANELTADVSQIDTEFDGVSDGGTALFDQNVATLWGDNVATILTINGMGQLWNSSDNAVFFTNVADWIGCGVGDGSIFLSDFESGDACLWAKVVPPGPLLSFTAHDFAVNEAAGTASVTVRRIDSCDGPLSALSVRCETSDGTATAGSDYTTTAVTLDWPVGDTANKICTIPITGDSLVEDDETINLALTNVTGGATVGTPGTAVLTIEDGPGEVSFTASSFIANEVAGTASITVRRTGGQGGAVSVDCQTADGTAVAPGDYTATTQTLNWADGDTADKICTVPVFNDGVVETAETVGLSLMSATGGVTLGTPNTATLTIGDGPGALSFTASSYMVNELDGTASVTVERTGGQGGAVSVDCTTADGTAVAPGDYTATTQTLNWAAGDTADQTCTVPVFDDGVAEVDETVALSLMNATGGAALGTPNTATLTIEDGPGVLSFTASSYVVNEIDGTASVTVERTGGRGGAVSVRCDTANGTATAGSDYTATMDTLNWADGDLADQTCTVPVTADGTPEGDETVSLSLTNPAGGATPGTPNTATLTIRDPGETSFTASSYMVNEIDGTASITVRRTGGSGGAVSVRCDTADGTATAGSDYTATTETLNWADGDLADKTCTVPVTADGTPEGDETVSLSLTNEVGAVVGTPNTATLTIIDPGELSFSEESYTVNEIDGTASITVQRTGGSGGAVSVRCDTANGTAKAGSDFTATMETLNWADGDVTDKTCTVPVSDDGVIEMDEVFVVSLTNAAGAVEGTPNIAVVTILDAPGQLSFTTSSYVVNEVDGTASIAVRRTGGKGGAVSARCDTADGTATAGSDYTATTDTLDWADGDVTDKTCTVPVAADGTSEGDETVNLSLTNLTGGATPGTPSAATLTIRDPSELSFTAGSYTVNEIDGTASIGVERTGDSSGAVSVRCDTSNGTATAGSDYTATMDTLNWADGDTTDKTCTVPVSDDGTPEGDETVNLSLTNATGALLGTPDTATLTIEDSPGELGFTASSYMVRESDGTASITVQRTGGQGGSVSVDCNTADNTAVAPGDYTATTDTLTWTDGDTADKTCTVPVFDDGAVESDETVDLALMNATGGASLGTPSTASLTIEDSPGEVSFTASSYTVNEIDGTASITVQRTGGSGDAASVRCDTADGGAVAPGDYMATTDTLNWADGDTADKTCTVPVFDDGAVESDEMVFLSLTNEVGAVLGLPVLASLTIQDAPAGAFSFTLSSYEVDERDGTASIEVQRTGGSNGAVSVRCDTADGTATAAEPDYTATMATLNWADGDTTNKTCMVPIQNDSGVEQGETVNLSLTNPTGGATLGDPSAATLTIVDDEYAGDLSFTQSSYQVDERDGTASFEVQRTSGSGGTVSVRCDTSDGTATTVGLDYTATMQTVTWLDDDNTNKTCTVPITDDVDDEGAETLNLSLTNVTAATLVAPNAVVLTIIDDDNPGELSFTMMAYTVDETAGTAEIAVQRTGGSGGTVSVRCDTADGTPPDDATEPGDYTATMQVVSWVDGDNADKTCSVPIVDDPTVETDESLSLSLTNVTGGATLGTSSATLTINDNM